MRGKACTIDSSCLIALSIVGLVPMLSFLFSRVLVPKAVRKEVYRRRSHKDRLQRLFDEFSFLELCESCDRTSVDILALQVGRPGKRDRGEMEAVVQAAERGAAVLIDDRWGRELARRYDLEHHGTLWVLDRILELGIVRGQTITTAVDEMQKSGIRLPRREMEALSDRAVLLELMK